MAITRTAWTDSNGTAGSGTVINNAEKTTIYDQIDSRWKPITLTDTGTVNNKSITTGGYEADFILFNNASDLFLTGIVAPASPAKPGKPLRYACIGTGNVYFVGLSGSSSSANQIATMVTTGNTPHTAGGGGTLVYDDANSKWRHIDHEPGGFIVPSFSAGDYIGNGSMTWTLTSGDVSVFAWQLRGKVVTIVAQLDTTTVGGSLNTVLQITNTAWGNFNATRVVRTHAAFISDNGTVREGAFSVIDATHVGFTLSTGANWAAATNATQVHGTISFQVT